jgi:precorrin-6B methylase 2
MILKPEQVEERLKGKCLFIATPCFGGMNTLSYTVSMVETAMLFQRNGIDFIYPPTAGDSLVTRARNTLVATFLDTPATHLMFIDADIGWRPLDILKMLLSGKEIVGGIYPKKCIPNEWPMNFIAGGTICPDTGYVEAKDLPTGFLMIERKVIEALIYQHPEWKCSHTPGLEEQNVYAIFDCYIDNDGTYLSEDFAFCRRAQSLGFKTWCDPWIELSHYGPHMYRAGCIGDSIAPQRELAIEGWMTSEELRWLKNMAREMDSVAEVGCWKGRSTHALASECKGTVYAVDHWLGSEDEREGPHKEATERDIFEDFKANVSDCTNIVVKRGSSVEMAKEVPPVDMVFIDGGHTFDEVQADIKAWRPKAKKVICGHDWHDIAVQRAVCDLLTGVRNPIGSIWMAQVR